MILNNWYAILDSKKVEKKLLGIQRFGKNLVLWRGADGSVKCFEDRCSHRGAALSRGKILEDGCIECPFHGFRFDDEGDCSLIPSNGKESNPPSSLKLKPYSVQEKYGMVWMWWGDNRSALPEIPWFEELEKRDFSPTTVSHEFDISFLTAMEASLDYSHFQFVHSFLKIKGAGPRAKSPKVEVQGSRINISGFFSPDDPQSPGVPYFGSVIFPSLGMNAVPNRDGSIDHAIVCACPITAKKTLYIFKFLKKEGSFASRIQDKLKSTIFTNVILPILNRQDLKIWSKLPRSSDGTEKFVANTDNGIIAYRRMWNAAQKEISSKNFETKIDLKIQSESGLI